MAHRATRHRHQPWERIKIHPLADREKITALKADMMRAFVTGDLDTYWRLDHELRWVLERNKQLNRPEGQKQTPAYRSKISRGRTAASGVCLGGWTRAERVRLAYSDRPSCKDHFGLCSAMTSARLRSRMRTLGYCSTAALKAARAMIG